MHIAGSHTTFLKDYIVTIMGWKIEKSFQHKLYFFFIKSNLENSSSHKIFLNWAAYLRVSSVQICDPIEKILWLDEFSKLLLNKMDFNHEEKQFNGMSNSLHRIQRLV